MPQKLSFHEPSVRTAQLPKWPSVSLNGEYTSQPLSRDPSSTPKVGISNNALAPKRFGAEKIQSTANEPNFSFHQHFIRRMMDSLNRASQAIGFLQDTGLCCETFTILRLMRSLDQPYCIELCNLQVSLIDDLYSELQWWADTPALMVVSSRKIMWLSNVILSAVDEKFSDSNIVHPLDADRTMHNCAMAVQILLAGILSYT